MLHQIYTYVFLSISSVLLVHFIRRFASRSHRLPLPPGPKPLPIIGNILEMPSEFGWETYDKWFKEFQSDLVYVNLAGRSVIIVNTYETAIELFEKRSSIYSSRIHMPMIADLMGYDSELPFMPYGEKWRAYRRIFHQGFNVNASKQLEPQQLKATHELLLCIIDRPKSQDLSGHFRHMTGSLIMDIVYGIRVLPDDDPYIRLVDKAMRSVSEAIVPGRFWVDFFPWLRYVPKWFPGAGFRRQAEVWAEIAKQVTEKPFEVAKKNISEGRSTPSFISRSLESIGNDPGLYYNEDNVKHVALAAYAGGADTTVSALSTFALAMLQCPAVQSRAQKELDDVLRGNLPTFDDQDSLPYVTAIVYETLRWKTIGPFGIPHFSTCDDIYKGYWIPAGSIVMSNIWSMLYDDEVYPDPEIFNPDRFLKDGKLNPAVRDPKVLVFGFGRRICPGRYMAYSTVWITIASMLATMEINKALDQDGNVVEPSGEYISGMVHTPKPFPCRVTPQSEKIESLIRNAVLNEA